MHFAAERFIINNLWRQLLNLYMKLPRNFRSTGSGFQHMGRFLKLPYLGMNLGHWERFQKFHIHSEGWNWAYCRSTGSSFRHTGRFSKLPYLGMTFARWPKCQKLHIYFLNPPASPNFTLFCSKIARFSHNWGYLFLHRVQWWISNFLQKKNR